MEWYGIALNGRFLEYYEQGHIYLVDGVIVPSVTEVVASVLGRKYDSVNPAVLQRAAERGTRIHEAIEHYCKTGEDEPISEVQNFKFLQKKLGFEVLANELPVVVEYGDLIIAGRLDMVVRMGRRIGGVDIKSSSTVDKERTALQLNLYMMGYEQCYKQSWEFIKALHLRGDTRKMIDLPINRDCTEEYLKRYKEELL